MKRYRYYLIRKADPDTKEKSAKRLCLPAHDVERIVSEQWRDLLTAQDLDVQLGIRATNESEALRVNTERLAKQWPKLNVPEQREALQKTGIQVVVNERRVELSTDPEQLATLLSKASINGVRRLTSNKSRRAVKGVDASLIKTAGETRIIEEDIKTIGVALTPGHLSLLRDIARGRTWAKALMEGQIHSAEEIGTRTELVAAQVARGLKCINVTPDLVDRLARGDGPTDLTWMAIRQLSPLQWSASLSKWKKTSSRQFP